MKKSLFQFFLNDAASLFSYLFARPFKTGNILGPGEMIRIPECFAAQSLVNNSKISIQNLIQIPQAGLESLYQSTYAVGTTRYSESELGFCLSGQLSQTLSANFLARNIVKKKLGILVAHPPIVWAVNSKQPAYQYPKGLTGKISDGHIEVQIFVALQARSDGRSIDSKSGSWRPSKDLYIYQTKKN